MAEPRGLIVDDDSEALLVLDEFVKREGFAVTRASTLRQAREELAGNPPDILPRRHRLARRQRSRSAGGS